jgi:phospholipid/cholesterol/gamma-HCH transport system ATP-binding protein
LANGKVAAQGTPEALRQTADPLIHQFVNGLSEGPVHFHYPAKSIAEDFSRTAP